MKQTRKLEYDINSNPRKINSLAANNFSFYRSVNAKNLVIIFGWLFFNERHMKKFREFYSSKNFDVIIVRVNFKDFLIPRYGSQFLAAQLYEFLLENVHIYHSIVIHSFSVGSYQFGELLLHFVSNKFNKLNAEICSKTKGIVYDSPIDLKFGSIGLAKSVTCNNFLQWCIVFLFECYLYIFHNIATKHYIASSESLHRNEFKYQILMFLSKDDVVSDHTHAIETINKWRKNDISVTCKCWEDSPHVGHYYKYPREYETYLENFLINIL